MPCLSSEPELSHFGFPEGVGEQESGQELSMSISPHVLSISNPGEKRADMRFKNSSAFPVYFKVLTTNKEAMRVVPSSGDLASGEEICIRVYCLPSSWPIRVNEEILVMTSAMPVSFQNPILNEFKFTMAEDPGQRCEFCGAEETSPSGHEAATLKKSPLDMFNYGADLTTPTDCGDHQCPACAPSDCLFQQHNWPVCSDVRYQGPTCAEVQHQCPARPEARQQCQPFSNQRRCPVPQLCTCTHEGHPQVIQGEAMMPNDPDFNTGWTDTIVQAWILACVLLTFVLVVLMSTCCILQLRRPTTCISTDKRNFFDSFMGRRI